VPARFCETIERRSVVLLAVYAAEPNPADPLAALVVGERPEPEVADGWVAVSPAAASLNMHDLWTLRGVGLKPDQYPMILGGDAAGTLADGTEVVVHPVIGDPGWTGDETLDPRRTLLTEKYQGSFAEVLVVPERNVIPLPAGMSTTVASVMGTAWLTAYRMLFTKSGLLPGQTMLVQGAAGGVSTALIQLGAAAGMTVWVTGRSAEKRQLAERLGAHATFEPGARLPGKVDAVFESVGEATWAHSMRSVRPGGAVICCGSTSGPNPPADLQRLFFLQIRVEGSTMGTRQELIDLLAFVTNAGIAPEIGLELPLEKAPEGFRAMLDGVTSGKIVFTR
jgi:NADPH:quinone reductase-like Zn-dependent oxidoreductase